MADTIIDNINSIIRTKSELKSVLTENGQNPSDTFSEYPEMFRAAIASGTGADEETINSYISAYLSTYNFIDQTKLSSNSYLTQHQDLSAYATISYVTHNFLALTSGNVGEEIVDVFDMCNWVGSHYASYEYLAQSYVTQTQLNNAGYITASDIPSVVVPVVNENLIPKETNTYTLGNSSYYYAYTYTQNLILNGTDIMDIIGDVETLLANI